MAEDRQLAVRVESYLRAADGTFVPVGEATETPPDPYYVTGAIELSIDGVPIIDIAKWDLVDQLWAYLVDMLVQLSTVDSVRTNFPDQPIRLEFSREDGDRVLVRCVAGDDTRSASTDRAGLVATLAAAADGFFAALSALLPQNTETYRHYRTEIATHLAQ